MSELDVNIPPVRYEELYNFAQERSEQFLHHFKLIEGAKHAYQNPLTSVIARNWKAQLEVTGADGFPPTEVAGNVLRPETTLKLSIRVPPTLDAE